MKKIIQFQILTILLIFLSITFFDCRKNVDDPINGTETPIYVESSVYGQVLDASGNPAEGVQVTFKNASTITDKYGVYILKNQLMNKEGDHIKFKKSGYFEVHRTVIPIKGKMVNLGVRLIERKLTKTIYSNQGGQVESNGTATVKFQANSFITSNSQSYSGPVNVYTYYLNPEAEQTQDEMPGNLTGRNSKGEFVILRTQGMLKVELEDASGNPLQLKSDLPAELSIPIQASIESKALSTIPLWYFDGTKGGWIEEGFASRIGDRYVGTVSHFTFWNWDFRFKSIKLKFRLVDKSNKPLSNLYFDIKDLTNFGHGSGETNSDGEFEGIIPENSSFELTAGICLNGVAKVFQSSNVDLDLGDIIVQNVQIFNITAKAVDCNNNPISSAYAILTLSNRKYGTVYYLNKDGSLDISIEYCNTNNINLKLVDHLNLKEKDGITIMTNNQSSINLGTISICDELKDFLKITINNSESVLEAKHYNPRSSLNYGVEAVGIDSSVIVIEMPDFDKLSGSPLLFNYFGYTPEINLTCKSNCQNVSYNLTHVGPVGSQVKGNFSGTLTNQWPSGPQGNISFTGSFSFKREH